MLDDWDTPIANRAQRWWRYHGEWHLGLADYELEWLAQGRPTPEHWDYHRQGSRWEHVDYRRARECAGEGHPNTSYFVWKSERSGYRYVVETCEDCGEKVTGHIGNRKLRALGLDRLTLPLAQAVVETHEVCSRCDGDDDVQLHHWAPRHLFDDADAWPQDYLCAACHAAWHRTVTPRMGRKAS